MTKLQLDVFTQYRHVSISRIGVQKDKCKRLPTLECVDTIS
jgi:hypothetical protein